MLLSSYTMEFSPRKNKSRIYCCVYGCKSRACKNDTVRFYHFPQKKENFVKLKNKLNQDEIIDRFSAWVKILKMGKSVSSSMRVCSLHFTSFTKEDFIPSNKRTHCLKNIAVPSVNLPTSSVNTKAKISTVVQASEREKRLINRRDRKEHLTRCKPNIPNEYINLQSVPDNVEGFSELEDKGNEIDKEIEQDKGDLEPVDASNSVLKFKTFHDMGVQVTSDFITSKFSNFITTDHELSTLTGIPNFTLLKTINKLVDQTKSPTLHLNLKLDSLEIIIMTFMKLKQNLSYAVLAILFKSCTPETCRQKFLEMIHILYICLRPAIFWPSKENILKNIPQCFREFTNVRTIVDCIEIPIQKPKNLCCQILTYSYYKSTYTVKFMTAVTPAGLISFVSRAYGGRASDNAIFEQSEILSKMDKKDDLMADRGFTVSELCKKYDIKLIIPPFLKKQKQFSKVEAIMGRSIAKARVHIERSNQRIKTFQIFSSKLPVGLINKVEEIFTIICAIVNLSNPILKDDKFQ